MVVAWVASCTGCRNTPHKVRRFVPKVISKIAFLAARPLKIVVWRLSIVDAVIVRT